MADHTLLEKLEQHGYKLTAPRLKLLTAILSDGQQFTAEEIYSRVPSVGRATVYRTIKLMVDLGVLCKLTLDDGTPRYRLSHRSHHHHLICTTCGIVADFQRCTVDDVIGALKRATGYQVEGHRIEVYGVCPECQAKVA